MRCSREAGLELALHAHLRTSEDSHDFVVGSTIWALQRNGKGQEEWYPAKVSLMPLHTLAWILESVQLLL